MKSFKSIAILACTASCMLTVFIAGAQLRLPPLISDHMVLQRDMPVSLWGWTEAGEKVSVNFLGKTYSATAGQEGRWELKVDAQPAGGPHTLQIEGGDETYTIQDVMMGDVWICSGQSNMQWRMDSSNDADAEIAAADHPGIRIIEVPRIMATSPSDTIPFDNAWEVSSPGSIPTFSAVAYYFGRDLNEALNVPIGLIGTYWGGTNVEAWTSLGVLENDPGLKDLAAKVPTLDLEEEKEKGSERARVWRSQFQELDKGKKADAYPWSSGMDRMAWHPIQMPGAWESSGNKELENLNGVVWLKTTFELPPEALGKDATLSLGPVDDSDMTWVNAILVGKTENNFQESRTYTVPVEALREGINTLIIRVEDYSGNGGLMGTPGQMFVEAGGQKIELSGDWGYRVGYVAEGQQPNSNFGPNSYPTMLYNSMIHPLLSYGIKGAIWYQGESNAGRAYQYRRLFPQMIENWRDKWGQGDFPFLFVQLANFMAPAEEPKASAWAELREAQDMTLSLPNTAMASAIDIGVANDIHPRNKQDVGRRLALGAKAMVYNMDVVPTGPRYESVEFKDGAAYVKFSYVGDGLKVKNKYGYLEGFTLAGSDKKFHWAKAELVDKNTVKVYSGDVKTPVAVRYGWADNPDQANLYNSVDLPTNPFRSDDWRESTYGVGDPE